MQNFEIRSINYYTLLAVYKNIQCLFMFFDFLNIYKFYLALSLSKSAVYFA